ncbi:MAG: tetratricopeptide repeat protein [Planctomycetota bacterium]
MRFIALLTALLALAPVAAAETSAWTMLEKGITAFNAKKYDRAGALFEAALRRDNKCFDASFYLGQVHEKKGKDKKAVAEYGRVPKEHSLYPLAQSRLGQLHLKRGEKKEALACLKTSVEMRGNANLWMQVAGLQIELQKFEDAEKSLEAASKLVKGDFRLIETYGRLYVESKKYGKALDQYNQLAKRFKDDYTVHNMRGLCLMELGREDEAARAFERVLALYAYHKGAMRNLIRLWEDKPAREADVEELVTTLERLEKYPPKIKRVKRRS